MIFLSQYPPFGEVVDYTKNPDGTITLVVDGVWADYNSDCAFTNTFVVQPFDDGTLDDSSILRSRIKKENGLATAFLISGFQREGEYIRIEDLDFNVIKW